MTTGLILFVILLLTALFGVVVFNALVRARHMMREGWSGIDVQLKRRADLVPNLVEIVKGFATHERQTFEEVIAARATATGLAQTDVQGRAAAEATLGQAIGKLFALAEAYPALASSENFRDLQRSIEGVETDLQMARRYYNGAARDLNVKVESFPSNLLAGPFGFAQAPYFEIVSASERAVPAVRF